MNTDTLFVEDLDAAIGPIPPDGIVSRTFYRAGRVRAVLFGMGAGQELTEHTTPYRALLVFVRGHARVEVAGETFECWKGGGSPCRRALPTVCTPWKRRCSCCSWWTSENE